MNSAASSSAAATLRVPTASNRDGVRVTPAFLRSFMRPEEDPAAKLFRDNRSAMYKRMEWAAREQKFKIEYAVEGTADIRLLQRVHTKLTHWAQSKGFYVTPGAQRPYAIIVSWDPIETPQSVTDEEKNNRNSVAVRRWQAHREMRAEDDADWMQLFGYAGNDGGTGADARNGDWRSSPATTAGVLASPPMPIGNTWLFNSNASGNFTQEAVQEARRTLQRAAAVAGANAGAGSGARNDDESLTNSSE